MDKSLSSIFMTMLATEKECLVKESPEGYKYTINVTTPLMEKEEYRPSTFNKHHLLFTIKFENYEGKLCSVAYLSMKGKIEITLGTEEEFINCCEAFIYAW